MKFKNILGVAILSAMLLMAAPAISQDNLLIIAPDEFIDALKPLKRFKDASGRPTILLSLSKVYNDFPGFRDEPETIKRAIEYYEKHHEIYFVMLVGDCDKFPVRYLCLAPTVPDGYQAGDLYYADLYKSDGSFDDWDGNGNDLYGQLDHTSANNNIDNINWYPDVAIARVPASSITEIQTYVDKVIRYEMVTRDSQWFKNAFLATGDVPDDIKTKDYIASNYLTGFSSLKHYHTTVWEEYPIDPNDEQGSMDKRAAPMTQKINEGVGFLNFFGHGTLENFDKVYYKRHLNDLTNIDKLPIIFAACCQTGEFAPSPPHQGYYDVDGDFHAAHSPGPDEWVAVPDPIQPGQGSAHNCDREARPEDWLVQRNTGAIAYVGSCGPGNTGWDQIVDRDFYEAYHIGYRTFGEMYVHMIFEYLGALYDSNGNVTHTGEWERKKTWAGLVRYMPFGDPSLRVGGAFNTSVSGNVYDGNGGPLSSYSRYRITGDVIVPAGETLTANQSASVLFEHGKKISAVDANPGNGFIVNGTANNPVYFLSMAPDPQAQYVIHGMKISGQLRMRNGGEIKLY